MAKFRIHDVESAPAASWPILEGVVKDLGFLDA